MRGRRALAGLVVGLLIVTLPVGASAHSLLLEASPPLNAEVSSPPRIMLRFNNRIEKALSRIRLIDAAGQRRDLPILPEGPPEEVRAAAPPLPPGRTRVEWHVLSTDGHIVDGTFAFRVVR